MDFSDLMELVDEAVETFLSEAREATATELGLDQRALRGTTYVTPEVLAVRPSADGSLQYYGGFEYVSKEHRQVMGGWVFYHAEASRVREHLAHVFPELHEGEWEDEEEFA
jgi:hypothetical protein